MAETVHGTCEPGFESLRSEFIRSFETGTNLGAGLVVYYKNRKVVDLHGGHQDEQKTKRYTKDTLNIVHSSGKFAMGLATLQAISQGLIEFDQKVADIWPEFGVNGKQNVTIKDVLEHQGGMTWVDGDHIPAPEELADLDALARRIAGQPHNFGGATTKAYHAITRGWVLNEVLRRVRPDGKSFGELVASEWCPKLEIDFYCGLPDDVKESRFNHVINSPGNVAQFAQLASLPPDLPMMKMLLPLAKLNDYDPTKGETFSHSAAFLRGQTPSASSVTNASSLAKLANCLTDSNRGNLDGYELLSPQVWERALQHEHLNKDSIDPCLGAAVPTAWGGFAWNRAGTLSMQHLVDFSKTPPEPYIPEFQKGEGWEWIGWGGAGGSIVQCAPKREVAMGFVPNWMLPGILGDERGARLMSEVTRCIDRIEGRI